MDMGTFDNPFDADRRLRNGGCSCGGYANRSEHDRASPDWPECSAIDGEEAGYKTVVAAAAMRAVFPKDAVRRAFLKSVGASTALAALAQFFPLATATEVFAQGAGAPEKKDLKVGFIPITCATPIIMAHPMGFYSKQGLNVEVVKTAGWAVVRDKTVNKEYDASHMLSPMPLALSLGLGSQPVPFAVPAIENINGQGITLAIKHKDKRDPKQWKGFKFAIPFDYSMHNYLLRYYLAEHGIDPEADVQLRVAAAGDGGQSARGQHRRLSRARQHLPAGDLRRRRFPPYPLERNLGRTSLLQLHRQQGVHYADAEQLRGAGAGDRGCDRLCLESGEPQADRRDDRARQLSEPAADRGRAGAHRHLCRWPRRYP